MQNYEQEINLFLSQKFPIEQPYNLSILETSIVLDKRNIYDSLVEPFTLERGEEVSLIERESHSGTSGMTLTYGEIDFYSMAEVYYTIENRYGGMPKGIFYDLGSGIGKCVLASALLFPFEKCKGIEILEGLYEISNQLKTKYDNEILTIIQENKHL